ncbi:MAG: CAP domain-containing protein [Deltaproteobacteria bacterium]|nr:CAP domain-containing protein [Deltaproteobacteria bacterium]
MKIEYLYFGVVAMMVGIGLVVACSNNDDGGGSVSGSDPSAPEGGDEGAFGDDDDDNADDDTEDDPFDGENSCPFDYSENPGCDEDDEACRMAVLINVARFGNEDESDCAVPIQWSGALAAVALAHAQDMCERGYVAEATPEGEDFADRLADAEIIVVRHAENNGKITDEEFDITDLHNAFMGGGPCLENERGHILDRDLTHVGVGVHHCTDGFLYVTEDFGTFDADELRDDLHEFCDGK